MTATPATRGWCGFRKQGVPGIREVGGSVQTGGARRGELRLYTRNPLPPDEDRTWTALDVAPDGTVTTVYARTHDEAVDRIAEATR